MMQGQQQTLMLIAHPFSAFGLKYLTNSFQSICAVSGFGGNGTHSR